MIRSFRDTLDEGLRSDDDIGMTRDVANTQAVLRCGLVAFETGVSDWLPEGQPKSAMVVQQFATSAPDQNPFDPDPITRKQYERLPDVVVTGGGTGPVPEHWAKGHTLEECLAIYRDQVRFSVNAMDTMFVRGHTVRVTTFNRLLRARYEHLLLRGLHGKLMGEVVPQPKRRFWQTRKSYVRQLREWINDTNGARQPPLKAVLNGDAPYGSLRQDLSAQIGMLIRENPDIRCAQKTIWGAEDLLQTRWFAD